MVLGAIDRGHNARPHGSRRENDSLLMWMEVRDAMAAVGVDSYYAVLERIRDALGMDMQEYLQAQIDG